MTSCFYAFLVLAGGLFLMVSLLRWFDQLNEAIRYRWWNKTFVLVVFPFSAWFYPSRIAAGRPIPVPHHEPVRGFGSLPKPKSTPSAATPEDQPPPGTPPEFLVKPQVPTKPKPSKPPLDPEMIAKLKQKMKDQGMLE